LAHFLLFSVLGQYEERDRDEDIKVNVGHFTDFNPRIVNHDAEAKPEVDRPYLILDTREQDEFRKAHIVQVLGWCEPPVVHTESTPDIMRMCAH
jgi:hypothetical protein